MSQMWCACTGLGACLSLTASARRASEMEALCEAQLESACLVLRQSLQDSPSPLQGNRFHFNFNLTQTHQTCSGAQYALVRRV